MNSKKQLTHLLSTLTISAQEANTKMAQSDPSIAQQVQNLLGTADTEWTEQTFTRYRENELLLLYYAQEHMFGSRSDWYRVIRTHMERFEHLNRICDVDSNVAHEALQFAEDGYETTIIPFGKKKAYLQQIQSAAAVHEGWTGTEYDVMLLLDSLAFHAAPTKALTEVHNRLRKGGLAYIAVPQSWHNQPYPLSLPSFNESIEEIAVSCGLTVVDRLDGGRVLVLGKFGTVDIIVPVYNALDYVKNCVRSVRAQTIDVPYRLVIVDDKSPDEEIFPYLETVVTEDDVLLQNEVNRGFVQTCNRAMEQSQENHVVLLNTDTVVTSRWLANMLTAMYQSNDNGVVNPLCNNATIFSLTEYDVLLGDYDAIQRFGEMVSTDSFPHTLNLPTAVGFCILFRRELIERIGVFDEIFGRGYGEENDFCLRAQAEGYRVLLTSNAFVYHEGSVSMQESGYIEVGQNTHPENEKKLEEKHPHYREHVHAFIRSQKMEDMRRSVRARVLKEITANKPSILFVAHNPVHTGISGGTEYHVKDVVDGLDATANCFVLHANEDGLSLTLFANGVHQTTLFPFDIAAEPSETSSTMTRVLRTMFEEHQFNVVHIHHTMGVGKAVAGIAKEYGATTFFTVHDYYLVSPDYVLMQLQSPSTGLTDTSQELNDSSVDSRVHSATFRHSDWLAESRRFLAHVDQIIAPSQRAADVLQHFFPADVQDVVVQEHGTNIRKQQLQPSQEGPIRICILGSAHTAHKGKEQIIALSQYLKEHQPEVEVAFHLLGTNEELFSEQLGAQFHFQDLYAREMLTNRLKDIAPHFIFISSVWEETYSYTVSEAVQHSIPVMTYDVGAQAERVREMGVGIVLPDTQPQTFFDTVAQYTPDSDAYKKLRTAAEEYTIPSIETMVTAYERLYTPHMQQHHTVLLDSRAALLGDFGHPRALVGQMRTAQMHHDVAYARVQTELHNAVENMEKQVQHSQQVIEDMSRSIWWKMREVVYRPYQWIKRR